MQKESVIKSITNACSLNVVIFGQLYVGKLPRLCTTRSPHMTHKFAYIN